MSIITYTRKAKCGDCKYLLPHYHHYRRKYHTCDNVSSPNYGQRRTLKDLVCDFWKYVYGSPYEELPESPGQRNKD